MSFVTWGSLRRNRRARLPPPPILNYCIDFFSPCKKPNYWIYSCSWANDSSTVPALHSFNLMPVGIKFYFTARAAVEDDILSEHLLLKAKKGKQISFVILFSVAFLPLTGSVTSLAIPAVILIVRDTVLLGENIGSDWRVLVHRSLVVTWLSECSPPVTHRVLSIHFKETQ